MENQNGGRLRQKASEGASTLAAINSALEGLMRGLTVDLAPIRVNMVSPEIVDTPVYAGMTQEHRNSMFNAIAKQLRW